MQYLALFLPEKMMRYLATLFCLLLSLSTAADAKGFNFTDHMGKKLTLSDYKGKWVLVNFWATWCPPCLKEIPDLVSLYESRNDVVVIGIAMDYADTESIIKFTDAMSIPYPIVFGTREIASQLDELSMLPSTYLFDPTGKPAARKVGILTREDIEKFIQSYSGTTHPAKAVDPPHAE